MYKLHYLLNNKVYLVNFKKCICFNIKLSLDDNSIPINDLPNDTEAAIRYIKTLLPVTVKDTFKYPPIVFIHQLYDIVHNKTLINKELVGKYNLNSLFIIEMCHLNFIHRRY